MQYCEIYFWFLDCVKAVRKERRNKERKKRKKKKMEKNRIPTTQTRLIMWSTVKGKI